jgi:hypothetical protein
MEEEYKDIAPYNKLEDGNWLSLWKKRHPLFYIINLRFSDHYDGKLTWRELDALKEDIAKLRLSLKTFREKDYYPRRKVLFNLIREQDALCGELCAEKLAKYLKECKGEGSGKYKCSKNWVCYYCQFKENGRCSHYYEIKQAEEEIEEGEYYYEEDVDKLKKLENRYERMLAVKENRLEEYLNDLYYDY